MAITRGPIKTAKKVVIYGPEGIGKSTLASMFPSPVFIDTEGSTKALDIARFDAPASWDEILDDVRNVPGEFMTLVIDTADWAEMFCIDKVCKENKKTSIEGFGYGKGYVYIKEEFKKILDECDKVIARGINVVFTAHAAMRKFEQPDEKGAYDRWEMKLTKHVSPLLKEWADILLFCNYKTRALKMESGKYKADGGSRVMYATHNPCWDAKNRYGFPDEMPMSYDAIGAAIEDGAQKKEIDANLKALMERDGIEDYLLREFVSAKGWVSSPETPIEVYPKKVVDALVTQWDKVVEKLSEGFEFD